CGIALFAALPRMDYKNGFPLISRYLMYPVTDYGKSFFYAVYAVLFARALWRRDKTRRHFCLRYLAAQILFSAIIVSGLKYGLGHARPNNAGDYTPKPAFVKTASDPAPEAYNVYAWGRLCLPTSKHQSMPSGHTTDVMISALPLALLFRRKRWVFALCSLSAALVAFSRLWIGVHHPQDVIAGVVIGTIGALTVPVFFNNGNNGKYGNI
ncbi:MAG: phosphatase PAP2 family protein, partial [Kiritimatiellaeota bacterium]|nr:phosphatase PAP2 family protein [Kiritimatiellota bacterium]